ncbi:MAG: hypothetical protein ACR2PL_05645 [Dehalococcoidia bacterium]
MEAIGDADALYRRLAPSQVNPDGSVNSAAYKRRGLPDPSISVDLARLTTPERALAGFAERGFGLGVLTAGAVRALGLSVHHDPLPASRAHAVIEGANDRVKCRLLAEATAILIPVRLPDR